MNLKSSMEMSGNQIKNVDSRWTATLLL